jgi:hypothetical protein
MTIFDPPPEREGKITVVCEGQNGKVVAFDAEVVDGKIECEGEAKSLVEVFSSSGNVCKLLFRSLRTIPQKHSH